MIGLVALILDVLLDLESGVDLPNSLPPPVELVLARLTPA